MNSFVFDAGVEVPFGVDLEADFGGMVTVLKADGVYT